MPFSQSYQTGIETYLQVWQVIKADSPNRTKLELKHILTTCVSRILRLPIVPNWN